MRTTLLNTLKSKIVDQMSRLGRKKKSYIFGMIASFMMFGSLQGNAQCVISLDTASEITIGTDPDNVCSVNYTLNDATLSGCLNTTTISVDVDGVGALFGQGFNFAVGTYTVTYTENEGSTSVIQTLIVEDDDAPIVTGCPIDQTGVTNADGTGDCLATVTWAPPSVSDNCPGVTLSLSVVDKDGNAVAGAAVGGQYSVDLSPYTATYTATDVQGNADSTCTFSITVSDNEDPVVTCPTDVTGLSCGEDIPTEFNVSNGTDFAALTGASLSDNCDATSDLAVSYSDSGSQTSCAGGTITRTYTITDDALNAVTCQMTFTWDADTTAPAVTGTITDSTVVGCTASDAPDAETTVAGLENLGLTIADACDLTVTSSDASTGTCPLVITRTYVIADACGNTTAGIVHTISVDDTVAPTMDTEASNSTVECDGTSDPGGAFAAWLGSYGGASASDACSASVLDQDNFDPQTTNIPVPGYNYDVNGDEFYQSFTAGQTGVLSSFSIKGNYSGYTNVTIRSGEGIGGAALYTGVWYITNDGSGSSTFDLTAPTDIVAGQVYSIQLQAGELSGTFQGNDNYAGGQFYWDGYGIYGDLLFRTYVSESILTWSNNSTGLSDGCGATGSETVTFTVEDGCGNMTSTTATFTIEDTTAPVVNGTITASTVEGCDVDDAPAAETTVAGLEALDGEGVNLDQKNEVYTSGAVGPSDTGSDWYQSFTAGLTGPLTSFSFRKNGGHSGVFDVTIHAGDGNTGAVLYTGQWTFDNTSNNWMTYDLTAELDVVAGEMYSIQLDKVSCTSTTCGMLFHGSTAGDTYTGGSFNGPYGGSPNNNDLMFRTYVNSGVLILDACSGNGELTVTSNDESSDTCPVVVTRTYTIADACGNQSVELVHTINIEDTTAPVVTGSITASTAQGCDASDAPDAETTVAGLENLEGTLMIADACTADGALTVTSSDASTGTCPVVITRTYVVEDACGNETAGIVHTITVEDTTCLLYTSPSPRD